MKIGICDVCYNQSTQKTITRAGWKTSMKSGAKKLQLDVCEEHRGFLKGLTFTQAEEKVNKLFFLS